MIKSNKIISEEVLIKKGEIKLLNDKNITLENQLKEKEIAFKEINNLKERINMSNDTIISLQQVKLKANPKGVK